MSMKDFTKLNGTQRILYRELYKKSFYDFAKDFWCEADPAPLVDGKVVQFLCELYQYMCRPWVGYEGAYEEPSLPDYNPNVDVIDVRNIDKHNACIAIPPRHSKSMILNVLGGVWMWINSPIKLASISHTADLAGTMNQKRQKILNSERFKFFFPEIVLEQNTAFSLKDSRGGELYSLNRNAMTGYGADILVCDDIVNAEQARKQKDEMNNAWSFFQNTLPSRINDPSKYVIFNVQQRLSPNDIIGRMLDEPKLAEQYIFITLPAQFDKETYLVCPISGDVIHFDVGQYLWEERFGDYTSIRYQVGETVWRCQYLQNPTSSDATIIKEDMIRELDCTVVPGWDVDNGDVEPFDIDILYASHDFPVKESVSSDFAGTAFAYKVNKTLYFFDCNEEKQSFVKSKRYVTELSNIYLGITQLIEDKANGSPLMNELEDATSGIIGYSPGTDSKEERMSYASIYVASGNVVFVRTKWDEDQQKWVLNDGLANLKKRLLAFPAVQHDDICDAFSMLVLYVFQDIRYSVYGRSFNDMNVYKETPAYDNSTTFFVREGDNWKVLDIAIKYDLMSKLIVLKEETFKADIKLGLKYLKEFSPDKNVFIDASPSEALVGIYDNDIVVEHYSVEDFERSVAELNKLFGTKQILISNRCKLTQAEIDNFKYDKREKGRFKTTKDGFLGAIRVAMKYYGGLG